MPMSSSRPLRIVGDDIINVLSESDEAVLVDFSVALGRRARPLTWRNFAVPENLSSQGPQHNNMGRQLFQRYPVFRQTVLDLDECHKQHMGKSLINDFGLFASAPDNGALPLVWPISLILPSIAVIGHKGDGSGDRDCAWHRHDHRRGARAGGTMAALSCPASVAERIIKEVSQHHPAGKVIEIACYNSPDAIALAGYTDLEEAIALAQHERIMARRILTSVPVHSSLMDLCAAEYKSFVVAVFARHPGPHRPQIPTFSTYTGPLLDEFTSEHFYDNARHPVRFTAAMGQLLARAPNAHALAVRRRARRGVRPHRPHAAYAPHQEPTTLLAAVGQAFVAGCTAICFNALNALPRGSAAPRPALPAYPFAKRAVEMFPEYSQIMYRQMSVRNGPLDHPDLRVNVATHPELAGHLINGEPIMPASGFVEMAFEFGAKTLWNVRFHSMLSLSGPAPTSPSSPIRLTAADIIILTCPARLHLHADGYFSTDVAPRPADLDLGAIMRRCAVVETKDFYVELNHFAQYGPTYRRLDELRVGGREVLARIKGLDAELARDGSYVLHPTLLDASLHAGIHPRVHMTTDPNVFYLPGRVNSIFLYDALLDRAALQAEGHLYAYATFQSWTPCESAFLRNSYDMVLVTTSGRHLCKLQGYVMARHLQVPEELSQLYELLFRPFGVPAYRNQNALRHVVAECNNKSDLRILEIQSAGAVFGIDSPLVSHPKNIAADAAPKSFSALQANDGADSLLPELDAQTIDLVILPEDSAVNSALLERLQQVLVPGGFVVRTTTSPAAWHAELSHIGFVNVSTSGALVSRPSAGLTHGFASKPRRRRPGGDDDDTFDRPIWLVASEGYDADGLQGFGRPLRREYPHFIVDSLLPQTGMECEFFVDADLCIKVPRIVASPAPKNTVGSIARTHRISLHDKEVLTEVSLVSFSEAGVWVVLGTASAVGSAASTQLIGQPVSAIVATAPSKLVRVSQSVVAVIPQHLRSQALAHSIAPLVFTILVLGDSILANPGDFEGRVVISHTDDGFGRRIILALCKLLGLRHAALSSPYSPEDLSKLRLDADDVVLTASDSKDELLGYYVQHAQVVSWTTSRTIQSCLCRLPSRLVKAQEGLCDLQGFASLLSVRSKAPEVSLAPPPQLFSADKSYILTGGVGSVGPYVALWMYQNGARDLVLTSRSGRGTLKNDGEFPPRAVNGADPAAMVKLVGRVKKPLGGVMLLAAIWGDRLFLDQDEESLTKCFVPMVGSLKALEAAVDIASLDFVVSMSSGTTFGNQGQTNYTSANIALDGIIKKYRNAFSIATPLVHDTVIATERVASGTGWINWACSPGEMCNYIEDGLRKLADGPLNIYVPAVDLDVAQKNLGPSALYDHLTHKANRTVDAAGDNANLSEVLTPLLLQFVDCPSPCAPGSSYRRCSCWPTYRSLTLEACITAAKSTKLGDGADSDPAMAAV
ncbi:polyketide synthase dehydratase-domain-containing protein [Mycena galericulata]|nr:polyketide synthase dehydratase-domain-containing protein [Mycena galericulata]